MVGTLRSHCLGPQIQSLIGELRSCKLYGMAKKKNKKQKTEKPKTKKRNKQKKKTQRLDGLNNRNYFFTVLEARNPRSRFWLIWFVGRLSYWLADCCFLAMFPEGERVSEWILWCFFLIKILVLLNQDPVMTLMLPENLHKVIKFWGVQS